MLGPAVRLRAALALITCSIFAACLEARAGTVVRFETVMGNIDAELCDQQTPLTVANFLAHVAAGNYQNTMIHRSAKVTSPVLRDFVIQGGGYRFNGTAQVEPVNYPITPSCPGAPIQCPVPNEPALPMPRNLRGTLAMARLGGQPNSASNQWFINLHDDNSVILDGQDGGFTVFGRVLGSGMAVADAIAALQRFQFLGAWSEAPMRNYTTADFQAFTPVDADNVVLIPSISVLPPGTPLLDFDGDGLSDACDICPTIPNAGIDSDMDGVDQACDTCLLQANPVFSGTVTNRTLVSGQLDDDADGRGNACDFDYDNTGAVVAPADFNNVKSAVSKLVSQSVCGIAPTTGQRCGEFDHDGSGAAITAADFNLAKAAVSKIIATSYPKCAACSVGVGWSDAIGTPGARAGRPVCATAVVGACPFAP